MTPDTSATAGHHCRAGGREFDAEARQSEGPLCYGDSAAAFENLPGQLVEIGNDEVGVYYPIEAQRQAMEDARAHAIRRLREFAA